MTGSRWEHVLSAVSVPSDLHDLIPLRCSICRHSLRQELLYVTKIIGDMFWVGLFLFLILHMSWLSLHKYSVITILDCFILQYVYYIILYMFRALYAHHQEFELY